MSPANDNSNTTVSVPNTKPFLIENWRATLKHAWSVKVDLLLILLSGVEFGFDVIAGSPPIDPIKFAGLAFLVKVTGLGLRFVRQTKVSGAADE
ncbi:hypothetical protein [Methylobacterium sp. 285MFTsu5.1]|uniref:DUF7940 domain-containing protein n=1 Tax=Methylobacterium sp. 285MFTsu5.1 TaxID=1172187 RepID=UPI000364A280|nr:hypothetical protein [Methylobacterium sp. 285MFTsu5.1]